MRSKVMVLAMLFSVTAGGAHAGRVNVEVVDTSGRPVAGAVVSLSPMPGTSARTLPAETRYVDQKNETFQPYVTALRVGDSIVFRNSDGTRHHVYSFSDVAKFEYMLRPGEDSPALPLRAPGEVAVGCNIHDNMLAYLYVTKDPEVTVTDAAGKAFLDGVTAGQYKAHAWHPQLRPGVMLPMQGALVSDTVLTVRFTLSVLPDPRIAMDREHIGY